MAKAAKTLQNFTPEENSTAVEVIKELTNKQKVFADDYLIHLQKYRAALTAGCPANGARQQGYEMYNLPHVKAYIESKLLERTITAEETIKLISDTAIASVTDYFKPVMVIKSEKIKVPLIDIIAERREYISREMEFLDRVGYTETAYDEFVERLNNVKNEIIRLEIELERDPEAFRITDGPEQLVEDVQLDLVALVSDKERGKVKKLKVKDDGAIEIEMYSAEDAQDKMLRIFGKYAPLKQAQTNTAGEDVQPVPDKRIDEILTAIRDTKTH